VNPINLGQFQFALTDSLPEDGDVEQSLTADALRFWQRTRNIESASDGVKAYTGILAAVLGTDCELVLIDEPEVFLHPPLARKLGGFLTNIARERTAMVFASTHSADFLTGCVQSGTPVSVDRLTHEGGVSSARLLEADRLNTMMRDPLMRSTGVLSALFYRGGHRSLQGGLDVRTNLAQT
jgi:predicted ATPase